MRPNRAPARSSRLAGAAGALLLQGGFLLLFLSSMPVFRPPAPLEREFSLILPRPLTPLPQQSGPAQGLPSPVRVTPPLLLPPGPAMTAPAFPPAARPGLQAFGWALNNCAPEKFRNLAPEERARCPRPGAGMAMEEAPNLMGSPSHVKDEAHWEDEWAREQSPPLLPCGGFTNVLCVLEKISDGSLGDYLDPSKWPHYAVKQLPKEELYKVEQAYDAWHKAHPDSATTKPPG